jgi:predicted TIM-barrel fold metal-dependent hydrolase
VFGPLDRFPYAAHRPYTPPEAPASLLRALHDRLGLARAALVNATPYGYDNRVVLEAIAESGGTWRGIATVAADVSADELARLSDGGIDGCRVTFLGRLGARPDPDGLRRLADRVARLGWHLDLYLPAEALDGAHSWLRQMPVPYVLDHMGLVDAERGLDQPGFQQLCDLLDADSHCWVKLSGAERISRSGPPFLDAAPFARRLIAIAPGRVIWGTDWPHPNVPAMPNDADLVDLVAAFAPDAPTRQRLLVDNPARLFRFAV